MKKTTKTILTLSLGIILTSCQQKQNFATLKVAKEINFGKITSNDTVVKNFKLINTSDTPLKISKIGTSCGCTGAIISDSLVKIGGFVEVQARFIPKKGEAGVVSNSIVIEANTNPSYNVVYLKGTVEN